MGGCQSVSTVQEAAQQPQRQPPQQPPQHQAPPASVAPPATTAVKAAFVPPEPKIFAVPEAGYTATVRTVRKLGWKRDLPDHRDKFLNIGAHSKVGDGKALPAAVDLRDHERFPVYDQGQLGSCTANAIAAIFHYQQLKQGVPADFAPSRLFIYYNERAMEDTIDQDAGAKIRDGIRSLHKIGVCPEELWAYSDSGSKFKEKPAVECYAAALKNTAKEYARVKQTLDDLKGCLAVGMPFVFGFAVFQDFMTQEVAESGMMKFPPTGECQGGHAVHCCGYDDAKKCFIIRNSWGDGWGEKGHFYMPYEFMLHPQLCSDFWAIKFVTSEEFHTQQASDLVVPACK